MSLVKPARSLEHKLSLNAFKALLNTNPRKSNFKVASAAIVLSGPGLFRTVTGWNREMGNGYSIHAEDSLAGKLRGNEQILDMLALGENGMPLAPCGNCREIVIAEAHPEAKFLAPLENGDGVWLPVSSLLPNTFSRASSRLLQQDLMLFEAAMEMLKSGPYMPYIGEAKAAALLTKAGNIYAASIKEDAAYHHDHSVEVVLAIADAARDREIVKILWLHNDEDKVGFFCGRCRQKTHEAAQVAGHPIEVISAHISGNAWFSNSSLLLPFAFGPRDLGIDVMKYLQRV